MRKYWLLLVVILAGCAGKEDKRFRLVPSTESGVTFRNVLKETVDFNIFNYMYFYNGAGVATGDVNGDNLPDIYFTSNQGENKLYLNQGNFRFKDATEEAGVRGFNGWATGVSMADVNGDGLLDIYVGYIGDYLIYKGRNQLFINEGNDASGMPKFKDRAMEFGLDIVGFATQSAFLDYDKDGDLDIFIMNHSIHQNGTFGPSRLRYEDHELAGDRLMRNDGNRFIEVTKEAGIFKSVIGYGLGVVVSDINMDGWPDIYVGNDFHENDYLYINQKNGTFREASTEMMRHTSRYTMGVDFADFNNDLFPDLIAADMLPADPAMLKASQAEEPYDIFEFKLNYGYSYQYARNMLQLNLGNDKFSEIGLHAGVSASDWSWSALFGDFDLDGKKDVYVSNGIMRRSNDMDYINFVSADSIQMKLKFEMSEKMLNIIQRMPQVKIPNYLFINNGDSTFTNKAPEWGLNQPSYSNGTAYADLDNDGDLDLVTNNVEDEAFLIENLTRNRKEGPVNHYLRVAFNGDSRNKYGVGAKVILYAEGQQQIQEVSPVRGYQSSVDARLTFGLGEENKADSLLVIWPDDAFEVKRNVDVDREIIVAKSDAGGKFDYRFFHRSKPLMQESPSDLGINFKHRENKFVEFSREGLMPHMVSAEGPGVAVGDVNGDKLEDVFIGGGKWQESVLFIQTAKRTFVHSPQLQIARDSTEEDVDAIFVDVDADHDNDLVIVSGGNEFKDSSAYLRPRLLLNDGKGNFVRSSGLPDLYLTGSSVSAADVNKDGAIDLLITARCIPDQYGIEPQNYLLQNDGSGKFKDVTAEASPDLKQFGFIKQSTWADIDGDGDADLLLAAEWKPITIFINNQGKLAPLSLETSGLKNTNGWWNTIEVADMDGDGDLDLLAGNLGLNSKLGASVNHPVRMYVNDFDGNGKIEQVLSYYLNDQEFPFNTHDEMMKQMPVLKKRYLSYARFAEATLNDIFDDRTLEASRKYEAYLFESVYVENQGGLKFKVSPLPRVVQFSTANAIAIDDLNKDGHLDAIVTGNFYLNNIQLGRYDASYGNVLLGDGKGGFRALTPSQAGFSVVGEVRHLKKIMISGSAHYVSFRNNDKIVSHQLR